MQLEVKVLYGEASKQLKQQTREVLGLSGAYDKLQAEYTEAKVKAQNLGAQMGVTSKEYLEASAAALQLNNSLKVIDAGIGNHQRNVGNYASGFINVNQVLREVPNFAISATTGIQALSNNLPMMVDEIKKFVAEGHGFNDVMKMIGKSIFSLGGAAILLTTILTALPGILRSMATEADKAAEKMKTFTEVQDEAAKGYYKEKVILEALVVNLKKDNITREEKRATIKKINDIIPDYLGKLTEEDEKTGKLTETVGQYIKVLYKMSLAQAYMTKISDLQAKSIDVSRESLSSQVGFVEIS